MPTCAVCGSRFAAKKCYFCQKHVCSSCMAPADVVGSALTVKCMACQRKGVTKISFLAVARRNKLVLGVLGGFWLFTVFPVPFLNLAGYGDNIMIVLQPVLMATAIMTIPFVFMMIAWQKRAPKG